jgi:sporulation protein YlmC with PRC-barrel domain
MKKQVELGARVRAQDGEVGTVAKVVVDPQEHQPGYLVIKRGRIRPRHVVVPVSLVADVSAEAVSLATTRAALDGFPNYEVTVRRGRYEKPVAVGRTGPVAVFEPPFNQGFLTLRQRSVPETSVGVERGMAVLDAAGLRLGHVHGLVLDSDDRQATHLVLGHVEPRLTRDRLLPVDLVAGVRAGEVHLHITAEYVQGLGIYQPAPGREDE